MTGARVVKPRWVRYTMKNSAYHPGLLAITVSCWRFD